MVRLQLFEHEDLAQAPIGALDFLRKRRIAAEVGDRIRQPDEMVDLEPAVRRQREDGDYAELLQGEVEVEELEAVRQMDDHAIETPQPACMQQPRE